MGPGGDAAQANGSGSDATGGPADAAATAAPPEALEPYDLVIIGGGIIGSGVARDAALRGLRVALVEKEDYGWGTTARSTRLVHGGLRYLEHYDFGLVREALLERQTLIRHAPHLVRPVPFLLPIFRGRGRGKWVLRAGLVLYDVFARANLGRHSWWRRDKVVRHEPLLDRPDLRGAFRFWDAQVPFPERLVVENMVDVWTHGGVSWNHTEAIGLVTDGDLATGVRVRDRFTATEWVVPARFVINVGGPWVTNVDNALGSSAPALTRRTKGIHLLVDKMVEHAMVLQCGDGERIIFLVPWNGYTLIGTTDTDYAGPNDTVRASVDDVQYLLDETNASLDARLTPADVHFTWAGLRPLIPEGKGSAGAVSRRHLIHDHAARDGPRNLVSVVGGKITSYRYIAEDIVSTLAKRIGVRPRGVTRDVPLPGGRPYDRIDLLRRVGAMLPHHTEADVDRLFALYGARMEDFLGVATDGGATGHLVRHTRLTKEEVRFAVEAEGARSVSDVLLRRTMLGLERGMALGIVEPLADHMAELLGWDRTRRKAEVEAYRAYCDLQRQAVDELLGAYEPHAPDPWYAKLVRLPKRTKPQG